MPLDDDRHSGDADVDVVSVSQFSDSFDLRWYENLGGGHFRNDDGYSISTALASAAFVMTADVDTDGDVDIVACVRKRESPRVRETRREKESTKIKASNAKSGLDGPCPSWSMP